MTTFMRKDDADSIRALIVHKVRHSEKSRAQIAQELSLLTGENISEFSLNKFTAESRLDYRWPAQFDIAFCEVIGDYDLLAERVKRAGFQMIGPDDAQILELGRQFLIQRQAFDQISRLESILRGKEGIDL